MSPIILLTVVGGVPALIALVMRVNAIFFFLSVAAGSLLVSHIGDDAGLALGMAMRGNNTPLITQFGLQLIPVVLTLLFMRKTISSAKLPLHVLPIIATGLSLSVMVLPFLASNVQQDIFSTYYGDLLKDSQDVVVSAAAIMVLLLAWATYRHKGEKHARKR